MEISTARRNRKKENKTIIYLKENSIFAISFQSKRLYNINIIHMKLSKLLFIPLTGLFMGGCDMIDYHPYDVRISGQTNINNRNIEKIEANCKDKATIRFVTMGDSQRWYDETLDFVNHLNKRDDIDFVIHGGDYSDFGVTDEFLWQRDIMNKLKVPYVGLIGNHDCLGTGEETFRIVFGDPNFSFIAGRIKFICLNTKTASSCRTIFMTSALKEELKKWLNQLATDERKDPTRYHDSGMLFRLPNGLAVEPVLIRKKFLKWQDAHPEFPRIVFHGLRHSSATYQLMISGGDVKAVQGTTGHATADMLVNTYAHIQQSSRVELGKKFEEGFYAKSESPSPQAVPTAGEPTISMTALLELLKNADPEVKAPISHFPCRSYKHLLTDCHRTPTDSQ